jgi:hypothetical protein
MWWLAKKTHHADKNAAPVFSEYLMDGNGAKER